MTTTTTVNNDTDVEKERFKGKARIFLNKLALELSKERPGVQYKVLDKNYWGEDPAEYISLVQLGPERRFFGRLKESRLISARCSDYKSYNNSIQIRCFDSSLENRAVKGFEEIGKTENGQGVHVWRHSYSL